MYVLSHAALVVFFCGCVLCISPLSSRYSLSAEEVSAYECGFEPIGSSHIPFCMKFFLLALLFLVFDVEVRFLVPSLFSSSLIFSFILVLLLGLGFEYAYGGLDWVY